MNLHKSPDGTIPWRTNPYGDSALERRCSRCLEWWPATRRYFGPSPKGLLGLHARCLPCQADCSAERRAARRAAIMPKATAPPA